MGCCCEPTHKHTYSISQYLSKDILFVYMHMNVCEYDEARSRFLNNYILFQQKHNRRSWRKWNRDRLFDEHKSSKPIRRGQKKLKTKKPWLDLTYTYTHTYREAPAFYSICFKMETIRVLLKREHEVDCQATKMNKKERMNSK